MSRHQSATNPGRPKAAGSAGRVVLFLFGIPFLASGVGILIYVSSCWWTYYCSASWVRVPVVIDSAEMASDSGGDSTTYSVKCRYHYEYGGRQHVGTRVAIMGGGSSDYALHNRRHRVLQQQMERERGKVESEHPFQAWVDPAKPDRAFLFREIDPWMAIMVPFGLTFGGAGGAIMGGALWYGRRKRRTTGQPPWLARADWRDMRVRHAWPQTVVWGGATLLVCFLSIFILGTFLQESRGTVEWVVFSITSAIAAGVIATAGASTLRLVVNGRPELALRQRPLAPGETLVAAVVTSERVRQAREIELTLTCTRRESGDENETTLCTNKHVLSGSDPGMEMDGRMLTPVQFDLPGGLPGTSDADPKVEWRLKFRTRGLFLGPKGEFVLPVFDAKAE